MDTTLQDPLVGHLLDGRYRVESRIARGGMAAVYLAVDTRLDRTVAVKVMHPGLAADEEFVARFIREAKSAARLSHPNVVGVFDQGRDGDAVFLAMEYVEGQTLRDLLRVRGSLAPGQAFEVLEPVLAALGAAHSAGIAHCDMKPENVLLADDGRVKVADFGLARAATASTSSSASRGLLLGTVAYLSPEQVSRGIAGPRSDVYAAGVLLYEMLTGEQPFDGESPIQVAYRHVHEDVPPPSWRASGLPVTLDQLVTRAASRDPEQRPANASLLLADVVAARRSLDGAALDRREPHPGTNPTLIVPREEAPDASPAHPHQPPGRRQRRSRGPLALALLLLLAAALGVVGWYLGAGPGSRVPAPSLLGLSAAQAEERAGDVGLVVRFGETAFSDTVSAGEVFRTDPSPTEDIDKDGTITAVLSKGPERYPVPAVVGVDRAEAEELIVRANLAVGRVVEGYHDTVPRGEVVDASPQPGERLRPDTPVDLVVSRGREPLEIPDLTTEPAERAREALAKVGFEVEVEQRYDEEVPRGAVISQDPRSGSGFRGDTVTLVASQGPPLVDVPLVVDQRVDEARRVLEEAGFVVSTRGTTILGRVLAQSPGRGQAPKGSTVTLTTI